MFNMSHQSKPETVLVTGASGFIALHIVKQLLEEGKYQVRGTVRSVANTAKTDPITTLVPNAKYPIELVEADLMEDEGWAAAIAGCDYVIHTASPVVISMDKAAGAEHLIKPAIEGTRRVLEQCAAECSIVKRVILTSSIGAVCFGNEHADSYTYTEEDWSNPEDIDPYLVSKTLAEQAAWKFVDENEGHAFEMVAMNPGVVFGPALGAPGASVDPVLRFMRGELMMGGMSIVPKFHMTCVHVEDVAFAHVKALDTAAAAGKRFVLVESTNYLTDVAQILHNEFAPLGYTIPTTEVAYWIAWLFSFVDAETAGVVRLWNDKFHCDSTLAKNILGVKFEKSIKEMMLETAHSLIDQEYVPRSGLYTSRISKATGSEAA